MLILYNILFFSLIILGFPVIMVMILLSEKRRKTVLHRLGLTPLPSSPEHNKPIWVHALSVGEVLSAVPLAKGLKKDCPEKQIFFSASTWTGFEIANQFLKKDADAIFFFPYDLLFSVRRRIHQVSPALVVIVETDIWYNFLSETEKANIPVILVNARLSKRSFTGYQRFLFFTKQLFLSFSRICTQSQDDKERFKLLGVSSDKITVTGNMKFDQETDPVSASEIAHIRLSMNIQPDQKIILAGSTHEGEEEILLEAFSKIKEKYDKALLILVPRDPKRARSVAGFLKSYPFSGILMSELYKDAGISPDVIIVDFMGVLRKLYAIADIAFIGGSLVNFGGHNPLEAAAYTKPILFGQNMSDFKEISEMLLKSGGAVQVQDADSFYNAAVEFLEDENKAQNIGNKAFEVFQANKGAVEKTLNIIKNFLATN